MEVAIEEEAAWSRRLTITVPRERVTHARATERKHLSKQVRLKGFRKGKVPTHLVEERYGPEIDQRTVSGLIENTFRQALTENELRPIGDPEIGNVSYEPGKPLTFQVQIQILPEINLARTGGFKVQRPSNPVTEEQVNEILEGLQRDHAILEPVPRPPEDGDVVSVRIHRLDQDEAAEDEEDRPYRFELGAGYAIPDVETAIRTMSPGKSEEFDITFPDDFEEDELAGSLRRLRIELVDVKARRLPQVDDELARSVGEFDSLEELVAAIRADVAEHHESEAERAVREQLIDHVIEANPFEVPPALIDRYLDAVTDAPEDVDPERIETARQSFGPAAERQIKRQLILERLVEENGLESAEEELSERLAKLAEARGLEVAVLRRQLTKEKRLDALRQQIATDKAFDLLESSSTID